MGPKKAKQPGAQDNEQKVGFLTNKAQALQYQIIWQQQRADRGKTQQNILRQRIVQLDKQFKEEGDKLYKIRLGSFTQMNEQYQQTEDELKQQVQKKKAELEDREQQIQKSKQLHENSKRDYEEKIKQKDNEINDLKNKMADLSVQFSKMLRETLEKMQQRIELQQWDNETDPHLVKKMKDLSEIYN